MLKPSKIVWNASILGLDVSLTDTGMYFLQKKDGAYGSKNWFSTFNVGKFDDPQRQIMILSCVQEFVKRTEANVVVMEDHAFGGNTGKARTRAELVGMIKKLVLVDLGLDLYLVAPSSLKKFMGCSAKDKSDKYYMLEAASRKFNFFHENDNIVDAYCLVRYLFANREGERLPIIKHSRLPVQTFTL